MQIVRNLAGYTRSSDLARRAMSKKSFRYGKRAQNFVYGNLKRGRRYKWDFRADGQ